MHTTKDNRATTSFFHRLRSGRSQQQGFSIASTISHPPASADEDAGSAARPSLSAKLSTTTAYDSSKQSKPTFSDVLHTLLPHEILKAMEDSNKGSFMDRVKKAGESTWSVFKQVLKAVKAASGSYPPLQLAVEALLKVLDQFEIMKDAQEDLFLVSQKMAALGLVLARYHDSEMPETLKDRIQGVADWMEKLIISIEAQNSRHWSRRFFDAAKDREELAKLLRSFTSVLDLYMLDVSISTEESLDRIETKIDILTDVNVLDKLNHVADASFMAQEGDICLQGTRYTVMTEILDWCNDASSPRMYWLCGMAGTGKSAIARTLCKELEGLGLLGGNFFCSRRASAEEQDIRRIIPTLAWQLSRLNREYLHKLVGCLKENPDVARATIERQLQELIITPCHETFFPRPLVLVIDALDEGARADQAAQLLEAVLNQEDLTGIPLRFFITSRPESHIRDRFRYGTAATSEHSAFHLHDIEESVARADIRLYVTYRLEKIRRNPKHQLPDEWPRITQIEDIVHRADRLFIYAFTVCNYIERDPHHRLDKVTGIAAAAVNNEQPLIERLDEMYTLILDEATKPSKSDSGIISTIRRCLSVLVFLRKIFSLSELAAFMGTDTRMILTAMDELHSLVLLPSSSYDGEVTTLHASLGDYLKDERRSGRHCITVDEAHSFLLQRCFEITESKLCFNIAKATTSFLTNEEQELVLPQHLLYAASRWSEHVMTDGSPAQYAAILHWIQTTLRPKFLFWLEVVSIVGRVAEVQGMLEGLLVFVKTMPELIRFLNDAIHFVHRSLIPIEQSVPHIYISALSFARQESSVRVCLHLNDERMARMEYVGVERSKPWDLCLVHPERARVLCVAMSPDGARIVSGSNGQKICVWDTQTGQLLMQLSNEHADSVSLAYSPDGTCIASGSERGIVSMWDARTGQPMTMWWKHLAASPVVSIAFAHDGTRIVSGSHDRMYVWNVETAGDQPITEILQEHTADPITSVAFSPDGALIVSGSEDGMVRLWDARTGQPVTNPLMPLHVYTTPVRSVTFLPNGTWIVTGSDDTVVHVWNARTGQLVVQPLQGHSNIVTSIALSQDGTRVVSGSWDGTVRTWSVTIDQPAIQPLLQGHTDLVTSVAFSHDGTRIVSGSYDNTVRVWSAGSGRLEPVMQLLHVHDAPVTSVAFSQDDTRIISGSRDKTVCIWDAGTGQLVMQPLRGHTEWVNSVALSPDGTRIASGSDDFTIRVWDAKTGQPIMQLSRERHETSAVNSVAFTPDSIRIVGGFDDSTVRIWDARTGQPIMKPLKGHTALVTSVGVSPDGTRIVSGSRDHTVCVWDAKTGQSLMQLSHEHIDTVTSVSFSSDSTRIISGSRDTTVCVWDAETGRLIMEPLQGHTDCITSVAISPDGTCIVSGSYDRTVHLWNATTSQVSTYPLHRHIQNGIRSIEPIAYATPTTRSGLGSNEEKLYLWDLQDGMPDATTLEESIFQEIVDNRRHISIRDIEPGYTAPDSQQSNLFKTLACSLWSSDVPPDKSLSKFPFRLSQLPSFDPEPLLSNSYDLFTLDPRSGWITGPNDELIIWIPDDLRSSLYMPRTIGIISQTRVFLDLSNFACGTEWTAGMPSSVK